MKTFKDLVNHQLVSKPMDEDVFWALIEEAKNFNTTEERNYFIRNSLYAMTPDEIVGYAMRHMFLSRRFGESAMWQPVREHPVYGTDWDTLSLAQIWAVYQGREFYEKAFHDPEFLIRQAKEHFNPADTVDPNVVNTAFVLRLGRDYLHYMDFIDPNVIPLTDERKRMARLGDRYYGL